VLLDQVKASESSKKQEVKIREELEGLFLATRKQHEDLARHKERATAVLDSSMRRLEILDAHAKNMRLRMNEVVAKLEVIQSSIKIRKQEKTNAQKLEGTHINQVEGCTDNHDPHSCRQLTLSDVQAATCKFSESFKIRPRSHGYVYKGEIMNRSVMIHKLHSQHMKSSMQFQQEVLPATLLLMLVILHALVINQLSNTCYFNRIYKCCHIHEMDL
jgi:hypothetical protein